MGTSSSRSSYSTILLDISEAKKRLGGKWKSYGKLYPGSDGNFEKFLNDVAPTFPKYLRRVLFNAFDTNGSGVVLAQEFISGIAIVINGTREEKSRFLFAGYDLDRAGRLSKRQFTSIIKHLNKNEEQNNNKLIHKILDRIEDKNISEAVFCEFVKRFEKQQFVMWIEVFRKCLIEKVSSRSITAFQSLWTPRDTEEIALAKAYDSLRDSSDMGVLDLKTLRFYLKSFDDENASETLMRYMNPTTKSSGISKRQFVNSLKPWILQEEEKSTKMNKLLNFTNKDTILCWRTIVHVEFGVLPLHKNLEALVIRTCQRNNDKSSQKKKFIISLTWWNKWIEYTEKNSNERPSKINNRRISRKNCVIVSERVWIALSSWYGGGPSLEESIIKQKPTPPTNNSNNTPTKSSNTPRPKLIGVVGLSNLGNTCYMNSSLQCLSNARLLREYFTSSDGRWRRDLNNSKTSHRCGMAGKMAIALAELLRVMWDPVNANRSIRPTRFKEIIGHYRRRFKGYDQQDAQELLQHLLSCVHEDMNRIVMRPNIESRDSMRRPDSVVASESWNNHLRRDLSIISSLFFGQFKSLLICRECGHESATFNPFSILPVPLPEKGPRAQVIRLHFGSGRMSMDLAVSLSQADMKQFTVETLLRKVAELEVVDSCVGDVSVVVEYSNSGTFINSVLNDSSVRLRTNDLKRPIDVWYFQGDDSDDSGNSSKEKEEKNDEEEFIGGDKVQINIRGKRALYPGANVHARYRGNGRYYPATISKIFRRDDNVMVNWIDNDSKYRNVQLNHIKTNSEKANSDIWIDAIMMDREDEKERKRKGVGKEKEEKEEEMYKVRIVVTKDAEEEEEEEEEEKHSITMVTSKSMLRRPVPRTYIVLLVQRRDGVPFSSPLAIRVKDTINGKTLYEVVMKHLRQRYVPDWDPEMVKDKFPFRLCFVKRNGRTCRRCEWIKVCTGCEEISSLEEKVVSFSNQVSQHNTIAIDWNNDVFREDAPNRYNFKYGQKVSIHESVRSLMNISSKEHTKPDQIEHCLRTFVKPEEIKTYCRRCTKRDPDNDFVETKKTKTISLWSLPPLLVFQLKRFKTVQRRRRRAYSYKLNNLIEFPVDCLDLKTFLADEMHVDSADDGDDDDDDDDNEKKNKQKKKSTQKPLSETEMKRRRHMKVLQDQTEILLKHQPETLSRDCTQYELFAVCNHRGAIGGGHYYTYAKSSVDKKWRVYNDTKVYEIDSKNIVTKNAYLLFYQRKDVAGKSIDQLYPNAPTEITRLSKCRNVEAFKSATWDKPKETEEHSSFFGRSSWGPFGLGDNSTCVIS